MDALDRRELLARAAAAAASLAAARPGAAWAAGAVAGADAPVRELARLLDGDVVPRGSAAWGRERLGYDTRFDAVRPRAVAYPESARDVARAVDWSRRRGIRLAARSGGHSYGGYSTCPGVVLDLSRLRGVRVDAARRTVTVGAGAQLVDVVDALARRGLCVPAGSCPTVGIGGLALGGGVGFASRRYGLTCDNVRELTLVTADARVRTCSARHEQDLFWASRGGGGGNFGVATRFVLRAHPAGQVATFRVTWPWRDAARAVAAWQAWAPHAPDALFSVLQLAATGIPGADPVVGSSGQLFGTEAELRALIAPLANAGTPLRVSVRTQAYLDAQHSWAGCSEPPERCRASWHPPGGSFPRATFAAKSDYAGRPFRASGIAELARWVERRQRDGTPGRGSVLLDSYGGAVNRVPKGATAFVHRDALCSLQYLAYWDTPAAAAANLRWLRRFHAAMRPHVSGFAYQNYIDPELDGWQRAYYGSNLPRLQALKRRHDPGNLFRFRQSIRPARRGA